MDFTSAQVFTELILNVDVFMVVFVRIMAFFIVLPVLSGHNIPLQARLIFSLGIALLAFVANAVTLPPYNFTILGFAILLMQEFLVGLILGIVVMIILNIFHFVGQLVDFQMGFGMVNVMDPFGLQQTPITGNFYFLIVSLFFMTSGAMLVVVDVFFESFHYIGLGQAHILGNPDIASIFLNMMSRYFNLGLHIALPIIGTVLIVDVVMGILVKAVPQMNVFVIGIPIKVMVGLIVVYVTMPFLNFIFETIVDDVVMNMVRVIQEMVLVVYE